MLIRHPRQTAEDLALWEVAERADAIRASLPRMARCEHNALEALRAFAASGPCYVGVSWGKDSVVVAHLAWRLRDEVDLPLLWVPAGRVENPDNALVRDAFLSRYPMRLTEVEASGYDVTAFGHDGAQADFERATRGFGRRYVSGVRAEESGVRKLRMRKHGHSSKNTCAPIGWWTGDDVFAYLYKYDLPVHPVYACSMRGAIPRHRLRVGTLGGYRGTEFGRREHEMTYYRAEIGAMCRADEGLDDAL